MPNFSFVVHSEEGYSDANPDVQFLIRQFVLPELNLEAKLYYQLINLNAKDIEEPLPTIRDVNDSMLKDIRSNHLKLYHPHLNQSTKKCSKLVFEAPFAITEYERKNEMIRQKLKLLIFPKQFDTKKKPVYLSVKYFSCIFFNCCNKVLFTSFVSVASRLTIDRLDLK